MSSVNDERSSGFRLEDLDLETKKDNSRQKLTKTGKILLGVAGGLFGIVCAATGPFIVPALRKVCLPFVPATTRQVTNVLALLQGRQGRLIDLGSGDGRIVIEAAKKGFKSHGVELNPWLVWYSRYKSFRAGASSNTSFSTKDLWKTDLTGYHHVVIFGVDCMMSDLEEKFLRELQPQAQIIVCRFPLPNLQPLKTVGSGIDTVWLYSTERN